MLPRVLNVCKSYCHTDKGTINQQNALSVFHNACVGCFRHEIYEDSTGEKAHVLNKNL